MVNVHGFVGRVTQVFAVGLCCEEVDGYFNAMKGLLPDALENKCSKCSEAQKKGAEKVMRFLLEEKPKEFKELEAKYDSEGVFRKRYEAEAKERGFVLPK